MQNTVPTAAMPDLPGVPTALGLGANLGEAEETLRTAARELSGILEDARVGGLYRSPPESRSGQPSYLNTAVIGRTSLAPEDLLALVKSLERRAGRRRTVRHGARLLDVDLLLYADLERQTPELTLPHPRLRRRAFVLAPLADVAPDWRIPPDGASVRQLLAALPDAATAERLTWASAV